MGFQEFVTERLAAITAQLNAIATNAKKIFELPRQNTLDPSSLIHVSRGGTSEGLEIQKIIDAIVERNYSQLLSVGEITVSGLTLTIPAGATWVYNGVYYATAATTNISETLCEAGYLRKDILVANQSNQIVLVKGAESSTIRIRPNIPVGTVLVTELDVDDTVIGTTTTPVIGEGYISKREKQPFQVYQSGEINDTFLDDFFYGYLNFRDDDGISRVTNLKSIRVYKNTFLYSGKEILVKNSQTTDITIFHLTGVDVFRFSFPNAENFVLKPNEIARFSLKILSPTNGVLEYVGVVRDQISDVVGLSAALDLKLDASSYNQHFKGVYLTEAALNAAHPTASVGDYAQVNVVGTTDAVNYNWDAEENIWIVNAVAGSGALNTDELPEGTTNLYWTVARFLANLTATNIKAALGITTLSGTNTGDETTASLKPKVLETLGFACSDETSNLTTGLKLTYRMPFAMTLSNVRISLTTATTIGSLVVDVKQNGTSIFSTLVSIDASELTSTTASVPMVLSTTALTDDSLMTIHVTQIGSGDAGKGLKVLLIGNKS